MCPLNMEAEKEKRKKSVQAIDCQALLELKWGGKGIFVGRIAVVFFSMFKRGEIGVSFVLLLLLSLADGGLV